VAAQENMKKHLSSELILDDSSDCEEDIADDLEPIMSFGLPPRRAELGQRAQWIRAAQERMEK
jgi:hypothetical protein